MRNDLTGIVLAGGRSSRFGSDKARALLGGEALVTRVVSTCAPLCRRVFVVSAPGKGYSDLLTGLPAGAVHDPAPHEGPLAGVLAGLEAARSGWALVCSCDAPLLQEPLLDLLLMRCSGEVQAVFCEVDGRLQPFPCLLAVDALVQLQTAFAAGERRVGRALGELRHATLTEAPIRTVDPQLLSFRNVNAPGDLAALAGVLSEGD